MVWKSGVRRVCTQGNNRANFAGRAKAVEVRRSPHNTGNKRLVELHEPLLAHPQLVALAKPEGTSHGKIAEEALDL